MTPNHSPVLCECYSLLPSTHGLANLMPAEHPQSNESHSPLASKDAPTSLQLKEEEAESIPNGHYATSPVPDAGSPKKFSRLALLVLAGLALAGLSWQGYQVWSQRTAAPQTQAPQGIPVQLAPAEAATIEDSSEYIAKLQSRKSVTLQPRVEGQVSKILVQSGDRLEAGTPVLQIDAQQQQATVASRNAALESARADLTTARAEEMSAEAEAESARADVTNAQALLRSLEARRDSEQSNLELNRKEFARYTQLRREGAVSQQIVDQRRNQLDIAQADLAKTNAEIAAQRAEIARKQAAIASAQANIAKAQSNVVKNQQLVSEAEANVSEQNVELQYYQITAPFTGVVGDIPIKVGDFVNTSTPLLTLSNNQELEIQISVPIDKAPQLRRGLPVELLNEQNQPIAQGSVFFISPNVDAVTQAILVKAVFDNTGGKLRTDQFVRARMIWSTRPGVVVPTTAISRLAGQNFIFVAERDPKTDKLIARQKPVKLGKIIGNNQEVLEGLQPNETIAVSGILNLTDGAPIVAGKP